VANGSHKEGPANADRLREKYAKHNRLTQKALDDARVPVGGNPDLAPYREEMDSHSEVTAGPLKMRGLKDNTVRLLGLFALVAFVAWLALGR
jgi:hypothetical protein